MAKATAKAVMDYARSQIGYCESPRNSNRTKYGKWFGLNGQPWCEVFEWACGYKAKGDNPFSHNASAATGQDETVSKMGGSWVMRKTKSKSARKAALKRYKEGDQATMDFGRMDAYRSHTGLIERVEGNYVWLIEGNTTPDGKNGSQANGGCVCRKKRYYTDICAVARPNYSGASPAGGLDVDGECGPLTIKAFQKWLGCKQTGKLDTTTIKAFQKRMNIPVTGKWDEHTRCALQRYLNLRNDAGLVVDGEVGYLTVCALQEYLNKVVK